MLCTGFEPCLALDIWAVHADPLLLERLARMETEFGSKSPLRDADGNEKKTEDDEDDEPIEEDDDDYQDDDDYYQVWLQQTVAHVP